MSDIKPKAKILGITGGIACGKSEVGRILEEIGFKVYDADHLAHALMRKGSAVYQNIVDLFGEQILTEKGEISRPVLGGIVFKDPQRLAQLNALVHPAVRKDITLWIEKMRKEEQCAAVLLPLLYESGMQDLQWDAVVCVFCTEKIVFQRLEKRGQAKEEAERRIHSQMPLAEKELLADYIISNIGTLEELRLATRKTVEAIMQER